jgi:hypothetical protein
MRHQEEKSVQLLLKGQGKEDKFKIFEKRETSNTCVGVTENPSKSSKNSMNFLGVRKSKACKHIVVAASKTSFLTAFSKIQRILGQRIERFTCFDLQTSKNLRFFEGFNFRVLNRISYKEETNWLEKNLYIAVTL